MDWVDRPQNYKDFYGILQLLQGSHLDNFPLKTLKLGWVAFHSLTLQLKCLDFQSNQYKKLAPVLPRFCNGLLASFFFCEFMDLDFVSVHKHAKKELGQYAAILTSHLVNNPI